MSIVQNDLALPPELIDLIISNLDNVSLKTSCLAASLFREPCQKRLLHSLQLGARHIYRGHPYIEVAARFEESPQLAGYVTSIAINIAVDVDRAVAESVLRRMKNVREATIQQRHYSGVSPRFCAEVMDWTVGCLRTHGALRELTLRGFRNVPLAVLERTLAATPSISFSETEVEDVQASPTVLDAGGKAGPESLYLWDSPTLNTLLLGPKFARYTTAIRALSLFSYAREPDTMFGLCFTTARTLERLDLGFIGPVENTSIILPENLPRLRKLTLSFDDNDLASNWILPQPLKTILSQSASPSLIEVILRVPVYISEDASESALPLADSLGELDEIFDGHANLRMVSWSMKFSFFGRPRGQRPVYFSACCETLRQVLPKAYAKGLLSFDHDSVW
ncbi:hypothetical protein C8F01DRAFT_1162571 [Mycena amicta]|nr:hypothetical protein C8F01DRAFT_1162571 [Mycena amicta]